MADPERMVDGADPQPDGPVAPAADLLADHTRLARQLSPDQVAASIPLAGADVAAIERLVGSRRHSLGQRLTAAWRAVSADSRRG